MQTQVRDYQKYYGGILKDEVPQLTGIDEQIAGFNEYLSEINESAALQQITPLFLEGLSAYRVTLDRFTEQLRNYGAIPESDTLSYRHSTVEFSDTNLHVQRAFCIGDRRVLVTVGANICDGDAVHACYLALLRGDTPLYARKIAAPKPQFLTAFPRAVHSELAENLARTKWAARNRKGSKGDRPPKSKNGP